MSVSAKNMEAVYKAKQAHDAECPWGGEGKRVLISPYDLERMGWEDGDNVAGLTVVSDSQINTGMLRVECDAEPNGEEPEITEAVSEKDLVSV